MNFTINSSTGVYNATITGIKKNEVLLGDYLIGSSDTVKDNFTEECIAPLPSGSLQKNNNIEENDDIVRCPKCGSTQITAQKRGLSMGRALIGGYRFGLIGNRKIEITCLKCGKRFMAGKGK